MNESDILALSADELESEIRRHNQLYWLDAAPEIADELYDAMVERLKRLAPDAAVLVEVGGGDDELAGALQGTKVVHDHPMLSLDKCYSEEELLKWFDRFEGDALATHKIDGVAMSVRYGPDGALDLAATRGNGRVGELITENSKRIHGVPHHVSVPNLEVRGEAYMPLSVFESRFAERFANPRNLTAGAIKQKEADKTADYDLHFFAYDGIGLDDATTETGKRELLVSMGFVPAPGQTCTRDTAQATFDALAAVRQTNDFETDGIVFKVNDATQHEAMGMTAHHPRWAIAYKYQGESGFSTLQEIIWNVSRSGAINPVAVVAPVFLSGVTVTRISLHNLAIMEKLAGAPLTPGHNADHRLTPGARVLITRRGGVIPHVEKVAEAGTGSISVPTECPSCGAEAVRDADFLRADHEPTCASQGVRSLEHFVKVADIQGFGPKILEQLWERDMVRTPADLYALTLEQLSILDRLGRRSAQNLVDAVDAHRSLTLGTFLASLGIPDLGTTVSRLVEAALGPEPEPPTDEPVAADAPSTAETDVAEVAQSDLFGAGDPPVDDVAAAPPTTALGRVRAASAEVLAEIPGIGPIVSQKIVDGLRERAEIIDALLEHVEIEVEAPLQSPPAGDNAIAGHSFVFTGAMERMGRKEAQDLVKSMGGSTPSGVSAKLDYLVLGDKDHARFLEGWRSSKLKKAESAMADGAALEIISESEFIALATPEG